MLTSDEEAWRTYAHHRRWFNKLDFALRMGYACGPCGTGPHLSGWYVVRPIYNLHGMGAGARLQHIIAGDTRRVESGYFWCQLFFGDQLSITYEWDGEWVPMSTWKAERSPNNLVRFTRWKRTDIVLPAPAICNELADVGYINVEFVGGRPIEVHLRVSPDPDWGDELIPVWADEPQPEGMTRAYDDAGGFIPVPRTGFIVR